MSLLERDALGSGASYVAAGMLAPVAELEFGQAAKDLLGLGLASAAMWPSFAAELEQAAGLEVGLRQSGTMMVARDADEARELERQIELRDSLGLTARRLRPSQVRQLEPALAPTIRLGLECPRNHSVEPRQLSAALAAACRHSGVQLLEGAAVARLELDQAKRRVLGVVRADGQRLLAGQTVLAAGAWTGLITGLPEGLKSPVRPVKGQIVRLRDRSGPGMLERVVRFQGGYVVPRADGRYVLGATVEEQGFDERPTAGAIHQLLNEAHELLPAISELEIEELSVGLRPGTPDNAPLIGPASLEGLIWASGHHRNGILLAPLTGQLVGAVLAHGQSAAQIPSACDPSRFAPGSTPEPTGQTRSTAGSIS